MTVTYVQFRSFTLLALHALLHCVVDFRVEDLFVCSVYTYVKCYAERRHVGGMRMCSGELSSGETDSFTT